MMKKIIKRVAILSSYIYTDSINGIIRALKNNFYSYWNLRKFKSVKNNSLYITFPIYLKGAKYIEIGSNFSCGLRLRLECWDSYENKKYNPKIIIGDNVTISHDCHIGAINEINIGNNVLIGSKVYISDHSHGNTTYDEIQHIPLQRALYSKGKVVIKENVWIGENVTILPNVIIGQNCIIGANTVVTKEVAPNSIVVGNPGKVVKIINNI